MSAVSKTVIPRSSALWTTFREAAKSALRPKLLQPSPTIEAWRPDFPSARCLKRKSSQPMFGLASETGAAVRSLLPRIDHGKTVAPAVVGVIGDVGHFHVGGAIDAELEVGAEFRSGIERGPPKLDVLAPVDPALDEPIRALGPAGVIDEVVPDAAHKGRILVEHPLL